ncbi:MAG: DNA photolyase family protein [Myxococcales bacterium]|nr:DNA photolyase family protein [Myxococcales bacterium]
MSRPRALVWFRTDLRLSDNPALSAAARAHEVVPVFIYSPEEEGDAAPGAASRFWLHASLAKLTAALASRGLRLILRAGPALAALERLVAETGAQAVFWNRRYEPEIVARDTRVKDALTRRGLTAESHNGALLFEPWEVQTSAGKPYAVFSPFWRACLAKGVPPLPAPAPSFLSGPETWPQSLPLDAFGLQPTPDWASPFLRMFEPGEDGAHARLQRFLQGGLGHYAEGRDRPDLEGVSRLSPHLHFGELSPRAAFHAARQAGEAGAVAAPNAVKFTSELGWREFAHHLLFHFPATVHEPLNPAFTRFPWAEDERALGAWQKGKTGYPLVDAGMRELWQTGFMHNRVRMVVASFLVKHLLLPWQRGAAWFWDTLLDADLANNTLGWQWVAGCGADAAPFFRIFNPVMQADKFDPRGAYIRRFVPELAKLPDKWLARPWQAEPHVLRSAGVTLGTSYPHPLVDHAFARERALAAFAELKSSAPSPARP